MKIKKSWQEYFKKQKLDNKISSLINLCYSRKEEVCPKKEEVLKIFSLIDFDEIKVIIIGQDPYPGKDVANGIAFSANNNTPTPASLKNIFKELENDLNIKKNNNDLSNWVEQGVFLINSSLTVIQNKPGSDLEIGWEEIIIQIIKDIYANNKDVIFCLWGNYAKNIFKKTNIASENVIESYHPSPLGYRGFKNSKPFSKINNLLLKQNKQKIKW